MKRYLTVMICLFALPAFAGVIWEMETIHPEYYNFLEEKTYSNDGGVPKEHKTPAKISSLSIVDKALIISYSGGQIVVTPAVAQEAGVSVFELADLILRLDRSPDQWLKIKAAGSDKDPAVLNKLNLEMWSQGNQ